MSTEGGGTTVRPRLDTVTVTSEPRTVAVEVRLAFGGRLATGTGTGAPTPLGTARAAALATLAAMGSQVDGGRLGLDTIVEGGGPGAPWVTVVVSVLTRAGVERLVGSALVEDGLPGAAVRATLQACNRRLGLLVEQESREPDPSRRTSPATDLAGIVAHQLRGPATTLVGYLELLHAHIDSLDDGARQSMLDHSLDGGRRLLARLENLLSMTRSHRLGPVAHPQRTPLHRALKQALADVAGPQQGIEVRCPDGLHVHADPDHLAQVVGNYLDNALRHGAPPIVVDATTDGDWVSVHVTDAGPGVDDTVLRSLFDLPDRRPSTATSGSGLGLYVARLLAEANGGTVDVQRVAPSGLRATVRVPAA